MSTAGMYNADDDSFAPFSSEQAAYEFIERCVWPAGPVCPHCGDSGRIGPLSGSTTRIGAYKCYTCRRPFTVKIGTLLEASNLPMHKWLQAIFLANRQGAPASASELHHTLGITPRTAWFVLDRVNRQASARLHKHLTHIATDAATGPARRKPRAIRPTPRQASPRRGP